LVLTWKIIISRIKFYVLFRENGFQVKDPMVEIKRFTLLPLIETVVLPT